MLKLLATGEVETKTLRIYFTPTWDNSNKKADNSKHEHTGKG